ncbi:hypothetical protein PG995_009233 [Apiospora arundinis]
MPEKSQETRAAAASGTPTRDGDIRSWLQAKPSAASKHARAESTDNSNSDQEKRARATQNQPHDVAEHDVVTGDQNGQDEGDDTEESDDDESEAGDYDEKFRMDIGDNMHPSFEEGLTAYFVDSKQFDEKWETARRRHCVWAVFFGHDFRIADKHFLAIASAPRAFRKELLSIQFSTDRGGLDLHDSAVVAVAQACPGLQNVVLHSCPSITDQSLFALLRHCPGMRTLAITGFEGRQGQIGSGALNQLRTGREAQTYGAALLRLNLTEQQYFDNGAVKKLSKARPQLTILVGQWSITTTWKGGRTSDEDGGGEEDADEEEEEDADEAEVETEAEAGTGCPITIM